jgi:hypothetical protein
VPASPSSPAEATAVALPLHRRLWQSKPLCDLDDAECMADPKLARLLTDVRRISHGEHMFADPSDA